MRKLWRWLFGLADGTALVLSHERRRFLLRSDAEQRWKDGIRW